MENTSDSSAVEEVVGAVEEVVSAVEEAPVPETRKKRGPYKKRKKPPAKKQRRKPVAEPVIDELSNINSLDDVKDLFDDGLDRLKEVTVGDVKGTFKALANRGLRRWRRALDEATRKD